MSIKSLIVGNFKGIGSKTIIPLKPITIFIGANSSGKSSCIHALACLSQTIKITNNTNPLILDDEFASIHLGRFKDVSHSRSYNDSICLGFDLENIPLIRPWAKKSPQINVSVHIEYEFKGTRRTQEILLKKGIVNVHDYEYEIYNKGDNGIIAKNKNTGDVITCILDNSFIFDFKSLYTHKEYKYVEQFIPLFALQKNISEELTKVLYLGPFRQQPLRVYPTRGATPREVGSMGEATVQLLANETIQSQTREHVRQVAHWLNKLGLGQNLRLKRSGSSDLFNVTLNLIDGKEMPLADLGYGVSQVLPVLTQCSFAPHDSTLLFEQPEIHLHSIASRALAGVFIETALDRRANILIETHSPEIIKEFQGRMRNKELSLDDFVVYRVAREDGATVLNKLDIDDDYDIYENWEKGISVP